MGKVIIPEAAYTINLLWSAHYPTKSAALEQVGQLMPKVRRLLAGDPPPSLLANPVRFEVLDLAPAFNHAPEGQGWNLSGLKSGKGYYNDLPYEIADPLKNGGRSCVIVARRKSEDPSEVLLPVSGRWASLLFIQWLPPRVARPFMLVIKRSSPMNRVNCWDSTKFSLPMDWFKPTRSAMTKLWDIGTLASTCPTTLPVRSRPGNWPAANPR